MHPLNSFTWCVPTMYQIYQISPFMLQQGFLHWAEPDHWWPGSSNFKLTPKAGWTCISYVYHEWIIIFQLKCLFKTGISVMLCYNDSYFQKYCSVPGHPFSAYVKTNDNRRISNKSVLRNLICLTSLSLYVFVRTFSLHWFSFLTAIVSRFMS